MDPVETLNCDTLSWYIRMACGKVIARDREEQAKKLERGR